MKNSVSFICLCLYCILLMPSCLVLLVENPEKTAPKPHRVIGKTEHSNGQQFNHNEIEKEVPLREQNSDFQDTRDLPGIGLEKVMLKRNEKKEEITTAEIHSSFEEAVPSQAQDVHLPTQIKQEDDVKIGDVAKELSETSQAVVFTLVDSAAAELQQRAGSVDAPDEPSRTDNLTVSKSAAESPAASEVTTPTLSADVTNLTETEEDKQHQKYVVRAEPKVVEQRPQGQASQPLQQAAAKEDSGPFLNDSLEEVQASRTTEDQGPPDPSKAETEHSLPEDIPSFSEWRLKHLAEDEQKKRDQNNATSPPVTQSRPAGSSKLHSKNYASPDCGAKIVAANPEATSASSVLSPSRDEYLLNTCTSRIWFVVELCEAIQAKKIEIANFELFSSPPREFSVYVSDRFPTRDWQNVGNFVAEDERTIQSFNLHPHLFGKFIKVEFHSHYGSEHFCPVSLFRAYGTSEFEVLKTVDQVLEPDENIDDDDVEDDDEPLDIGKGEPSTIFDNARYAILSIVTKAAEALGKSGDSRNNTDMQNNTTESFHSQVPSAEPCRSPRHIVVCDNCSDSLYGDVFKLLSCEEENLHALIESPFVSDTIRDSKLCAPYGLDFPSRKLGAPFPLKPGKMFGIRQVDPGGYIMALFPPKYIAALCNMLAVFEKRVALNVSEELNASPVLESTEKEDTESHIVEDNLENVLKPVPTCTMTTSLSTEPCNISSTAENIDSHVVPVTVSHIDSSVAAQIKPTKTLERVDDEDVAPSLLTASKVLPSSETVVTELPPAPDTVLKASSVIQAIDSANGSAQTKAVETKEQLVDSSTSQVEDFGLVLEESVTMPVTAEEPAQDNLSLDSLLNELKDLERVVDTSTAPAVATTMAPPSLPTQQVQKESVFVRLANKIKALERNMSLSGQYLEELSKRYKKQVEDMQKSFNRTLSVVLDQNRKAEEREKRRLEEIVELKQQLAILSATVETIVNERTSWAATGYALMQPLFFIVVFAVMLQYLKHHANHTNLQLNEDNQRRFSIGYRSRKLNRFEKRRRSVEGVTGHEIHRLKKRRPSEDTLVSGSYYELLIPDNQASEVDGGVRSVLRLENKRRRRKKKDSLPRSDYNTELQKPTDTQSDPLFQEKSPEANNPSIINGFHSSDHQELKSEAEQLSNVVQCTSSDNIQYSSAESLLKTTGSAVQYSDSSDSSLHNRGRGLLQLEVLYSNKQVNDKVNLSESVPVLGPNNGSVKHQGLSPKIRNLSAPLFMKTAMAARSGRRSSEQSPTLQAKLKSDNWEWYSSRKGNGSSHTVTSTQTVQNGDGSSHATPDSLERTSNLSSTVDPIRKEGSKKQTGGLKKIGSWRIQSLFKN
ncbi:SUN domain-containing ossification factor isoform X1 [Schistocerca piceifrons]|uniref:SUN domain-containing ossification factor isoform X1 n=1 Tax=Schistocerca piceifrons TaxID=274613 RepID=UPI001F5F3902|nr:SUN domain-containing ossification factor isoform X1 [Schistocerca piceifrons]